MFYSKTTNGFYIEDIHGSNMPDDVVEITKERHQELLAGQDLGKSIGSDEQGNPVLIDRPAPSYKELRAAEYPSIGDQLDALWKGGSAAEEMLSTVMAVKTKYPKSE